MKASLSMALELPPNKSALNERQQHQFEIGAPECAAHRCSSALALMSPPPRIIAPVLLTLLLIGCQTTAPVTPREAFFRKHPDLRARYTEFYETSPEAVAAAYDEKLTFGIVLISGIKKDYAKYPDLAQNLDIPEKRIELNRDEGLPIVKEIKKVFNPKTDALFWYDYGSGDNQGQGYLIVRNGDFYRTFWVAGSIKKPNEIP
jgi:hypothetical protein